MRQWSSLKCTTDVGIFLGTVENNANSTDMIHTLAQALLRNSKRAFE